MFAMLNGPLPALGGSAATPGDRVAAVLRLQAAAGLELLVDGGLWWTGDAAGAVADAIATGDRGRDGLVTRTWRSSLAIAAAEGLRGTVAAVLPGPLALAGALSREAGAGRAVELATTLGGELAALEEEGCALAVIEEPAIVTLDDDGWDAFAAAHGALLARVGAMHAMLAITGGAVPPAGRAAVARAAYGSVLLDLVAGPDNWYLARQLPGDRGIVCAAYRAAGRDDQAPLLTWAARYAASMDGRGLERVGLANATPLDGLDEESLRAAAEGLARAAGLAAMDPDDAIAAGLDRRTFAQPPGRGARPGGLPRA